MGIFEGIDEEKPPEGGRYISQAGTGTHYVMIERLVDKGKGKRGASFIAEVVMLESTSPKAESGGAYSWVQKMEKKGALSRVLGFFMAATALPQEEIDEEGAAGLCAAGQPCAGVILKCDAFDTTTEGGVAIIGAQWEVIEDGAKLKALQAIAKKLKVYPAEAPKLQADRLK